MISPVDVSLSVAGAILPTVFAGLIFFHRRRIYATWAKGTSIIVAIGGFVWGSIHWVLLHSRSWHLTRDTYYLLVGYRGVVTGLTVGFALSILIARPYKNKDVATRAV
jgi:TRAP-type C4-dicarboxylate transport system permease small subunit